MFWSNVKHKYRKCKTRILIHIFTQEIYLMYIIALDNIYTTSTINRLTLNSKARNDDTTVA